ncbi:MAG: type II secretion system inner membrane protein GspF [Myxococcota bacterium]
MPVYEYKGLNSSGRNVKGMLDAENQATLRQVLKKKGVFVTEVNEGRSGQGQSAQNIDLKRAFEFVTLRDIAVFTRQLSTLQRAGIPLVECLNALTEQTDKDELKRVISEIRTQVNEGSSLAQAMAEHQKHFSDLFINMVRAGESSGNLDVVLERLTDFLEAQMDLRSKIISAMIYPLLMTLVGVGILAFLFAFVIPKVTRIFADQEQALPLITQILIGTSDLVGSTWFILIPGSFALAYAFNRWRSSEKGKPKWDEFLLKVPVVGGTVRMIAVSRFASTLGTLLSSGVPLLQALDIVKNILGNQTLIEVIEEVRVNVREGESIAQPLKRSGEFPPLVTHMIAIGERTGQLEEMLHNVSTSYKQQVDLRIQAATTLIEPLMIVLMGVAVGFIVFAIMLPILQLNQSF